MAEEELQTFAALQENYMEEQHYFDHGEDEDLQNDCIDILVGFVYNNDIYA